MILFYVNRDPPCLLYNGFWDYLGGKQEHGTHHSPPSSTGLQMGWSCSSVSSLYLHSHIMG
jgi:hypothetical protein